MGGEGARFVERMEQGWPGRGEGRRTPEGDGADHFVGVGAKLGRERVGEEPTEERVGRGSSSDMVFCKTPRTFPFFGTRSRPCLHFVSAQAHFVKSQKI